MWVRIPHHILYKKKKVYTINGSNFYLNLSLLLGHKTILCENVKHILLINDVRLFHGNINGEG